MSPGIIMSQYEFCLGASGTSRRLFIAYSAHTQLHTNARFQLCGLVLRPLLQQSTHAIVHPRPRVQEHLLGCTLACDLIMPQYRLQKRLACCEDFRILLDREDRILLDVVAKLSHELAIRTRTQCIACTASGPQVHRNHQGHLLNK